MSFETFNPGLPLADRLQVEAEWLLSGQHFAGRETGARVEFLEAQAALSRPLLAELPAERQNGRIVAPAHLTFHGSLRHMRHVERIAVASFSPLVASRIYGQPAEAKDLQAIIGDMSVETYLASVALPKADRARMDDPCAEPLSLGELAADWQEYLDVQKRRGYKRARRDGRPVLRQSEYNAGDIPPHSNIPESVRSAMQPGRMLDTVLNGFTTDDAQKQVIAQKLIGFFTRYTYDNSATNDSSLQEIAGYLAFQYQTFRRQVPLKEGESDFGNVLLRKILGERRPILDVPSVSYAEAIRYVAEGFLFSDTLAAIDEAIDREFELFSEWYHRQPRTHGLVPGDSSWRQFAGCRGWGDMMDYTCSDDLAVDVVPEVVDRSKLGFGRMICGLCPVQEACRDFGLKYATGEGLLYAGMTDRQRQKTSPQRRQSLSGNMTDDEVEALRRQPQ